MKLLKLNTNRVWRTYLGGKKLEKFLSDSETTDKHFPEEWIGSVVKAINPNSNESEGLSKVNLNKGKIATLLEIIESDPNKFLGEGHVKQFGHDTGVLVKLLDAAERLSIQVHPNKEKAKSLFNSNFGKTEAWYILGGRSINGEEPHIYFGFKQGITQEVWEEKFSKQDIDGMLNCMHKIYVKPGEVYLIEGGMPHAIGAGCFILEIQEPTDYTVRVERSTPNGYNIPDELCHQGLGFKKMFDCFEYSGYSKEEVLNNWRLKAEWSTTCNEQHLIRYKDTPCFSMDKIVVDKSVELRYTKSFSILIVMKGKGRIIYEFGEIEIQKGDKVFIPAFVKKITCKNNNEDIEIIRCFPPKL
ncbi:class I mannose-6-phosphate isomerase [Clostridium sediminicola]|uniref:type I phosphomannose isomerase catalytic subunit n=1 Tax=Clostridium sediminicola TaxID=3114879 RepID=UPI0031F1F0A8